MIDWDGDGIDWYKNDEEEILLKDATGPGRLLSVERSQKGPGRAEIKHVGVTKRSWESDSDAFPRR